MRNARASIGHGDSVGRQFDMGGSKATGGDKGEVGDDATPLPGPQVGRRPGGGKGIFCGVFMIFVPFFVCVL